MQYRRIILSFFSGFFLTYKILVAAEFSVPKLELQYSQIFDQECAKISRTKVEEAWINEARKKTSVFQNEWDQFGPELIKTTYQVIGKGFLKKELIVTLMTCSMKSLSHPILINVGRYLKSKFHNPPWPLYGLVDTIFHEFLHHYVIEHLNRSQSTLHKRYENEKPSILYHLHLMAIQRAVYLKLNRHDLIQWLDRVYSRVPTYQKAWKIVKKVGYEAFIQEF